MVEQKAFEESCGQHLAWSKSCAECGNVSPPKKAWARSFLADAESEPNGADDTWHHETPSKEELELVRHSNALRLGGVLMRRAYFAVKLGDWETYLEDFFWATACSACGQVRR